jgi:hypothetical protein
VKNPQNLTPMTREDLDAYYESLSTPDNVGPIDGAEPETFGKGTKTGAFVSSVSNPHGHISWPRPKPLPTGLAPVEAFDLDFLPQASGRGLPISRSGCSALLTSSQSHPLSDSALC